MTYEKWLNAATELLISEAKLQRTEAHIRARILLDDVTGTRFAHLLKPDSVLEPSQLEKLSLWQKQALARRPIPYITGHTEFFGHRFEVDENVLIPRPETELLVETVLEYLPHKRSPRLADLGTGSGAIAVALQKARPDAAVYATDLSEGALAIARRNAERLGAEVHFLKGSQDWIAPLSDLGRFDAIVSNPPYIAAAEIETLQIEVRDYEPRSALDGGRDGLDPYRNLAAKAADVLENDGFVAVELGAGQWGEIGSIFEAQGWKVKPSRRDLAGIERVLVARR